MGKKKVEFFRICLHIEAAFSDETEAVFPKTSSSL